MVHVDEKSAGTRRLAARGVGAGRRSISKHGAQKLMATTAASNANIGSTTALAAGAADTAKLGAVVVGSVAAGGTAAALVVVVGAAAEGAAVVTGSPAAWNVAALDSAPVGFVNTPVTLFWLADVVATVKPTVTPVSSS